MQDFVFRLSGYIGIICQLLAMLVISTGILKSMILFCKKVLFSTSTVTPIKECRMVLGHSFSLGLSFLIGASILKTTIAPTWNDIGQLASIIAIRTLLNYFLVREIDKHEDHIKVEAQQCIESLK